MTSWMIKGVLIILLSTCSPAYVAAQQVVDAGYAPKLKHVVASPETLPIAVDEAHRNLHTIGGEYAPFARLLSADGYHVVALNKSFSAEALNGIGVLVIANARRPRAGEPAFSGDEIAAVRSWVDNGGSLFLIADHAPFGTAALQLAEAFGVEMGQGYVAVRQNGEVTSQIDYSGNHLGTHVILSGHDKDERVRRVTSFTGQSLSIPAGASPLLLLPSDALEVAGPQEMVTLRQGGSVSGRNAGDRAQAIALPFGKGRVVVAGEAAMFTSQRVRFPNGTNATVGLTVADDQQFALNVVHWLSRKLE